MPLPKFCQCLPCMPSQSSNNDPNGQNLSCDPNCPPDCIDPDNCVLADPRSRGFTRRQISKAVAIVLTGYGTKAAAKSLNSNCDAETVDYWVQIYRPPFFEIGMNCPPALILWWMKEMDKKEQTALTNQQWAQNNINNLTYAQGPQFTQYPCPFMTPNCAQMPQNVQNSPNIAQNVQNSQNIGQNAQNLQNISGNAQNAQNLANISQNGGRLVMSSPTGSQPNVRVFYQDDATGQRRPVSQNGFLTLRSDPVELKRQLDLAMQKQGGLDQAKLTRGSYSMS